MLDAVDAQSCKTMEPTNAVNTPGHQPLIAGGEGHRKARFTSLGVKVAAWLPARLSAATVDRIYAKAGKKKRSEATRTGRSKGNEEKGTRRAKIASQPAQRGRGTGGWRTEEGENERGRNSRSSCSGQEGLPSVGRCRMPFACTVKQNVGFGDARLLLSFFLT